MPLPTMKTPSSRQRPPDRQMLRRIQSALERQLHGRHVRVRIRELQRYERPVVVAAFRIRGIRDAGIVEQPPHASSKSR
jgi:sirohydrochlorin ferrochelatase